MAWLYRYKKILVGVSCFLVVCLGLAKAEALKLPRQAQRSFFVEEKISITSLPENVRDLRIWLPLPKSDKWQVVEEIELRGPFDASVFTDKEHGNKIIYLAKPAQISRDDLAGQVVLRFKVKRIERGISAAAGDTQANAARFIRANRHVPVNGEIKKIALQITQGKNTDREKARAVYDYLISNLTYVRDDPRVCGLGNSLITLKHKKGICSDWHSLFISLVRSLGIPAEFEIGFPIPEGRRSGQISGYHCWARFYARGEGWVPVDASEAYKHPRKRDYLFGHLDENRVMLTQGRDIRLKNAGFREPLNFFVYPYIEVNGQRHDAARTEVSFKEVD